MYNNQSMKIFYGYDDQHYINVTSVVFDKCFKDNVLVIPKSDNERTAIMGFDPYPNVLKHILIVDYNKNKYTFLHHQECRLSFDSIVQQLRDLNPRYWWNSAGTHISDPNERLKALHQHLLFENGDITDELPEQLLSTQFIKEDAKVLEIGGNLGRNTLVISTLLKDPSQHVVLECNPKIVPLLQHNLRLNNYSTHVEPSALSYTKLLHMDWVTVPVSEANEGHKDWTEVPTITYEEIEKKYNIQFDTLVADCEGALYYILKDNPSVLDTIKLVIMENDYHDVDQKQMVDAILYLKGFTRAHHVRGGWGPCFEYFYEVWVV
uniref:Methyltransferase FkbM domain-containing protein n=1 Tax=viral metagenome TaxID=1070528 RepID=A0A6C0KQ04_9ZZZZ